MKLRHRLAVQVVVSCLAAGAALAGPVGGKVELAGGPPLRPPPRMKGFLDRIENPHLPVRPVDPMPSMVVVLEGGPADGTAPTAVTWDLLGDSFARPVLAVRAGTEVIIRNKGRGAPVLVATGKPDLLARKPINPTAEVHFVAKEPGVIELVDQESPHLRARVLVVAGRWFATPDSKGEFTIADVPAGDYTLRVWYDGGWIDRADDKLSVSGSKKVELNPKLPSGLPVKP